MQTVEVALDRGGYPVYLGRGLLADTALWRRHLSSGKTLVVSNDVVAPLYLERLTSALDLSDVRAHIVPDGEQFKTLDTWFGIIDSLVATQARRDANVIALGGGVVGDMAGFAAACYMRGIRFIQAPTTLLAQVDASVGGKTAINHVRGKNLVGAFHQPAAVVIDYDTLSTLPAREYNAGLAEVVKCAAIRDPRFYGWLLENHTRLSGRNPESIDYAVCRSVANKAEIVVQDEKESGVRALLNLGHSFGHALESVSAYKRFLHGEAVAIGMVTAARLSERRKLCPPGTAERLADLLSNFSLPVRIPADMALDDLAEALQLDKKAVAGGLRLILLNGIGQAVIDGDCSSDEILQAMKDNREGA